MARKDLSFRSPPQLAVAIGATTPNPGIPGALVWSTSLAKLLLWNGTNWGLTSGAAGVSQVDFGAAGKSDTSFVVTGQTGILSTSSIFVNIAAIATADHSVDEHLIERITVVAGNIVVGTSFTILACTQTTVLRGAYSVAWKWV